MARKHGLGKWLDNVIKENKKGNCKSTYYECEMLSRMVNEERINRTDIPKIVEKSYRHCIEDNIFDKVKKLPNIGIYSKLSVLLYSLRNKKK